jgi:hypothetical protein
MNYAPLSSPRLQRVLRLLADGEWHSTMTIIQEANVCAVSAVVSELRANGVAIECAQRGKVWVYRLFQPKQLELAA